MAPDRYGLRLRAPPHLGKLDLEGLEFSVQGFRRTLASSTFLRVPLVALARVLMSYDVYGPSVSRCGEGLAIRVSESPKRLFYPKSRGGVPPGG